MAKGDGGWCPACGRTVSAWEPGPGGRPRARCPHCNALERHRFLALLIDRLSPVVASAGAVLDIAPQRQVRGLLEALAGDRYVGMDLLEDRRVDVWADLTQLPFADGGFDVVVCYHVLEHIPEDAAAIRELARVLSPGGIALVQVPWRRGAPTEEDPGAPEDERIRRFGRADHVRRYGDDLLDRLETGGLHASVLEPRMLLDREAMALLAVSEREAVLICRRASSGGSLLLGHEAAERLGPVGLRAVGAAEEATAGQADDAERRRLAAQVHSLEQRLEAVYRSRTWRVGSAVLAVPKRVRGARRRG